MADELNAAWDGEHSFAAEMINPEMPNSACVFVTDRKMPNANRVEDLREHCRQIKPVMEERNARRFTEAR